jgi:hypothetical protein
MAMPVRNTTGWVVGAQMVNVTDGAAYVGTVTCHLTKDGVLPSVLGTFNSGLCTALGNGFYVYHPTQAETNYGVIDFTFSGTGAIPNTRQVPTMTAAQAAAIQVASGANIYTVRAVITDALMEIGVLEPGESPSAAQASIGLRRTQGMIDSWAADRLTLSLQLRTPFTWPANTSSVQVGRGQTVDMDRPVWVNNLTFVVPGTNPGVEVPMGLMDEDAYASLTIKNLTSQLPQQAFYQTNVNDPNGTLFIWPTPPSLTLVLYTPQAVSVPANLNSLMQGPPGYQDAFLYQLALRLCTPFGVAVPPLLPRMAASAFENMKKPNVEPGSMGLDPALVPSYGAGYNVLTDSTTFSGR